MAISGDGKRLDVAGPPGVQPPIEPGVQPPIEPPGEPPDEPASAAGDPFPTSFPTLDEAMRRHIEAALVRCKGRIEGERGAARLLAVHANTLRSRMHKLGIRWERFR